MIDIYDFQPIKASSEIFFNRSFTSLFTSSHIETGVYILLFLQGEFDVSFYIRSYWDWSLYSICFWNLNFTSISTLRSYWDRSLNSICFCDGSFTSLSTWGRNWDKSLYSMFSWNHLLFTLTLTRHDREKSHMITYNIQ